MPERYLGRTLGKYRVESLLGSGGFAWVFKGYDPELDIPVAIKVLKPQFAGDGTLVERFRREASTAAKLRHPNIIKIYAVGREGDAVYFVMDYLPGGLADRLEATPHLPEDYVVRIGIDVARALGFAHREGVIHRDIKVDNILFDTHGNAVVADFGIARAVSGYTHQTGTNMVVGTPQYFAPEQARAKPLDGRADIYSLGVTLFRSVTGRLPFEGDDWYEIARQHVEEPPPSPRSINSAVSGEFDRLLLRCLAKTPEERPATGEQLADDLERILALHRDPSASRTLTMASTGGTTVIAPVASLTKGPVRRVTSARVLVPGALVVAGLVAAGVLVFGSLSDGGASPPLPDSTGVVGTDTTTVEFAPADSGATGSANPAGREGGRAGSSSATRGGATARHAPHRGAPRGRRVRERHATAGRGNAARHDPGRVSRLRASGLRSELPVGRHAADPGGAAPGDATHDSPGAAALRLARDQWGGTQGRTPCGRHLDALPDPREWAAGRGGTPADVPRACQARAAGGNVPGRGVTVPVRRPHGERRARRSRDHLASGAGVPVLSLSESRAGAAARRHAPLERRPRHRA
ncbi:MAG TPA: protein kinase [Gemmatimonadaceae bacterium]|nr:protein kinase [Gemmatimonadaceae bacterium]